MGWWSFGGRSGLLNDMLCCVVMLRGIWGWDGGYGNEGFGIEQYRRCWALALTHTHSAKRTSLIEAGPLARCKLYSGMEIQNGGLLGGVLIFDGGCLKILVKPFISPHLRDFGLVEHGLKRASRRISTFSLRQSTRFKDDRFTDVVHFVSGVLIFRKLRFIISSSHFTAWKVSKEQWSEASFDSNTEMAYPHRRY